MSSGRNGESSTTNESETRESAIESQANNNLSGCHQDHLEDQYKYPIQNGNTFENIPPNEINKAQGKHTEYIPSQIVTFVATSGINTVSNDRSGQQSAGGTEISEGIIDSKKYRVSQALYDATNEKGNETDLASKKRKTESTVTDHGESSNSIGENNSQKNKNNSMPSGDDQESGDIGQNNLEKLPDNSKGYIPSEYGSCGGCVSTTTKSNASSTKKIETQSTNTPNSKGGISHEDLKEH